ncbi:hypothetical protein BKA63DRAFT_570750 [Paraphoma chrysanthemicola]|nr:hypothetical protein BKA63DRAFT_570750 [Paraphoma chrysanthemicola]
MAWVQSAVFANTFDPQLASTVKESMTQKMAWLRGLSAEIYDIALSIKRTGDRSFAMSSGDIAMANYLDVHNFLEAAIKQNDIMVSSLEFDFILRLYSLDVISCVDRALVILLDMGKQYFELGLNHPIKAGKAFANAYIILPSQEIKDGHQSAKAWKDLDTKKRIACLKVLFADLPKSPISVPDQEDLASPSVASEHWVLRELGFKGHIPCSNKIKSNHMIALTIKPHPDKVTPGPLTVRIGKVLPEALAKHVERYEKGKDWPGAEGKLVC